MTRNDKIERAFTALKQAITAASVIVGDPETDFQMDTVLSVNRMMDEAEYILNIINSAKEKMKKTINCKEFEIKCDSDLSGADLSGADLSGANLRGANLRGANLIGANLRDSDLSVANLRGANLRGANMRGANMRGADLSGANLSDSNLIGANMRGADLSGANLRGADLRDSDLSDSDLDFSCLPLWCGGQGAKIDSRLAKQFVLHALAFDCDLPEYARLRKEAEAFCADSHRRSEIKWNEGAKAQKED